MDIGIISRTFVERKKIHTVDKLTLIIIFSYQFISLYFSILYKYWINSPYKYIFSRGLLFQTLKFFDLLYTGNLFWTVCFLISSIALINIFFHFRKVNPFSLKVISIVSIFSYIILLIVIFQGKPPKESFSDNLVSLSAKGITTILAFLFSITHIFIMVSLCVISFSALMKLYFWRSSLITILIISSGYLIVFLFCYNFKDDYSSLIDNKISADAGIVLGAAVWGGNRPSPVLRERINKGYELYSKGTVRYIVLTGGGSPGEMTEAEVSKNELLKKGVKEQFILIENKSNSTLEQISYLSKNVYRQNNWNLIVIVSDNFHLLRTKQISRFFGLNVYTVSSDTPLSAESTFNFCLKESLAVILFWLFGIG